MHELAHRLRIVVVPVEDGDLVGHRALPELVDPQGELHDGGKGNWCEVVTVGMHYQADQRGRGWVQGAVLDEVCVHDRVEAARHQHGTRRGGMDGRTGSSRSSCSGASTCHCQSFRSGQLAPAEVWGGQPSGAVVEEKGIVAPATGLQRLQGHGGGVQVNE